MEQRGMYMSRGDIHCVCLQFFATISTHSICDDLMSTEFQ